MKFNQTRFWLGIAFVIIGVPWLRQGLGAVPTSVLNGNRLYAVLGVVAIVLGLYLIIGVLRDRRSRGQGEDPREQHKDPREQDEDPRDWDDGPR